MAERRRLCFFDRKFENKISATVEYMEKSGFCFRRILGNGAFGCVVEMEDTKEKSTIAVKIVNKKPDVSGEITIWRTLAHSNILKLLWEKYVSSVDSYIFVTPIFPFTLEEKLLHKSKIIKIYVAVRWLENMVDAFSYLHYQKLCYLDLKCNNILISHSQKAVLCDFGYLTRGDNLVENYGSPLLYGPPEAYTICGIPSKVNGYTYDVWRIGMLAFEIFTRMSLFQEMYKCLDPFSDWITLVYPAFQKMLTKERFFKLMTHGYGSGARRKIDDVLSFLKLCLHVIQEKRPKVEQLLSHHLFGGSFENAESPQSGIDIWNQAMNIYEVKAIIRNNMPDLIVKNPEEVEVRNDKYSTQRKNVVR